MTQSKVGSADNKNLVARRLREKHNQDKAKIEAIEDKIDKARRRKTEISKETSTKAQNIPGKAKPNHKDRPNSDFDPKAKRNIMMKNRDINEITNMSNLKERKPRAVESTGYSQSTKIDELNTQSRSKRSNYEYANDSKGPESQKLVGKYSNLVPDFGELDNDVDSFLEDKAFMFSLPPDDDDDNFAYSDIGLQYQHSTPINGFDLLASEGGDQIDLLMNAYRHNPSNNIYQQDTYGPPIYPNNLQGQMNDLMVMGRHANYSYFKPYPNDQFNIPINNKITPSGVRKLSSNAIAGKMMTNNGR